MKNKSLFKRALSAVLCAVMLVSCWVFTAPSAEAATAGNYDIKLTFTLNDGLNNLSRYGVASYIRVYYVPNNGTDSYSFAATDVGEESSLSYVDFDLFSSTYLAESQKNIEKELPMTLPGFPVKILCYQENKTWAIVGYDGTGYDVTKMTIKNTSGTTTTWDTLWEGQLHVYTGSDWRKASVKINGSTFRQTKANNHADQATASNATGYTNGWAAKAPKATNISAVTGTGTIAIPKTSTSTTTSAYTAGTVTDQYGVNWYQDVTSLTLESTTTIDGVADTALRGVTFDSSTKKLTITNAANAKEDYKIYLKQTCGTATQRTYINLTTFDYNVTFMNGSTNLGTWSFDYGETPVYGSEQEPTKTDTANPPKYAYTFDGWAATSTGNVIELPTLSGVQAKTYYAHFSQSLIDYTVKFVNNENTEISSAEYNIDDTLTPPDSALIPDTYKSVDKVYTFTGWVGTNGEVYTDTCQGAITYKPVYSDKPRQYTVTFQEEDGTVIKSQKLNYNTIPSSVEGLVPTLIDKDPDDTNHYTPAWSQSVDTGIKGDTVFRIVYTAIPHTWVSEAGVVTKEGTCSKKSIVTKTCSVCEHDVEIEGDFNSTKHDMHTIKAEPKDGMTVGDAFVCCQCSWCEKYWAAKYNGKDYDAITVDPDTHEAITGANEASQVKDSSEKVPSPYFNSYQDGELNYYYGNRGCSLKLMKDAYVDTNTRQDFRFSGSVEIPKGVSYEIGSSNDNVIKDFGFVYSQDSHIWNDDEGKADTDQLVLDSEDPKIASMSVVNNNAANGNVTGVNGSTGRLIGENGEWSGVTFHPGIVTGNQKDPDSLTFNLVISIKAKNWKKQYAARPYITYKYHGVEYTVYDTGASDQSGDYKYSYGSVYAIAAETIIYDGDYVDYVINRFINHRSDFGEDDAQGIDWWRYYFATTWAEFEQSDYGKAYKNALARHEAAT